MPVVLGCSIEQGNARRHGQERPNKMDTIYILTGLGTFVLAVGGLILTCHLERRSLATRRNHMQKQSTSRGPGNSPVTT
jgi:hypothetical protein